jgi:hypothetical protein
MKRADHHLVQQVLDGDVSQETFHDFQNRLRKEPGLKKLYEEYALLQHALSEEFEGKHGVELPAEACARRRFGIPMVLAVAVVLACIAALGFYRPWNSGQKVGDVAVLTFSVDAVWRIDGSSRRIGGATGVASGSVLHLSNGRAGVSINPVVTALVEGPAELRFLSSEALLMARGRAFFNRGTTGGGLTLTTPRLTEVGADTRFGIEVPADGPDEVLVSEGTARIVSSATDETVLLVAGEAARVPAAGPIERFPADGRFFAKSLAKFKPVVSGPFDRTPWRLDFGNPSISGNRIDGENYSVFLRLPEPVPGPRSSVLLATLDVGNPSKGEFHTDGWAGMSFFSKGVEVLFFGDSFGTGTKWSLDVKQRIPVIQPERPVTGPRMVTLRYDRRSGEVSLHEGGLPPGPSICSGRIPPGTVFDEIRLGASSAAALAVKSLTIRVDEE